MASIVYIHDKRTGITYVYSQETYWCKEKKQSRSHRKLLGRLDPETKEIIPTSGKRGRPPKSKTADIHAIPEGDSYAIQLEPVLKELEEAKQRIDTLSKENMEMKMQLVLLESCIRKASSEFTEALTRVSSEKKAELEEQKE